MEEYREDREMKEFSWPNLFLVTGCCFVVFAGVMKQVEGSVHPIFLRIGITGLTLWFVSFSLKWLARRFPPKKDPTRREELF